MSRPNQARRIGANEAAAGRIQRERESHGWSYETVARKMTALGCAINQSAIYKIESASPRREIKTDELVALGRVFGLSLEELTQPPALQRKVEVRDLFGDIHRLEAELWDMQEQHRVAQNSVLTQIKDRRVRLAALVREDPDLRDLDFIGSALIAANPQLDPAKLDVVASAQVDMLDATTQEGEQ